MRVSCLVAITAVLIVAKLAGWIQASWLLVLAPLWVPCGVSIVAFAVAVVLALLMVLLRL